MGKRFFAPAALASALLFSAGAAAQDEPQTADVRCLLVTLKMMTAANTDEMKATSLVGVMYYMGKLDGRQPDFDLESAVIAQIKAMTPEDVTKEAQRCGTELQARGKSLQEIGGDLTSKGY
jgi:hypothetical protein